MRLAPLAAALLLAAAGARAELAAELAALLDAADAGSWDFVQQVTSPRGKVADSKGTLAYQRPDRFRLEYAAPAPLLVVGDGAAVWVYDAELAQAVLTPQAELREGRGLLDVLAGDGVAERFGLAAQEGGADGLRWLLLTPPEPAAAGFELAALGFDGEGRMVKTRIDDLLGNRIEAHFAANGAAVGPALFAFEPPDGVEIID
ncbi:MAG: outer-membrane lipoprotein carrier protein LolA [Betaproteobacteria bacterium AqS2]|uniref:Outer-membrane lipoprotein carrier protein LolA n=1 Tax=Candidatus Amphirhobacter heronislandensis TaxID=1732024 RepID=A0A930XXL1_9GAMM|nr:outer-membrane lipoprotein carrier protein LolA [Betaproteobacteria bacterium AqS2]